MGDFNSPLLPIDRSVRQKVNREILVLTDIIKQMEVTDIYRTLHQNKKEYTFSSEPHGTFSNINHTLIHKESLNKYKKFEITP